MAITLNPVNRDNLAAFIADQRTIFDFEQLFAAVLELQAYMASVGDIVYSAGTTRAQALSANGASYLRAAYPALFAKIGTTYGAADGTHFNVPLIAGRVIAGKEATATLLTVVGCGIDGGVLGAAGGIQNVTLSAAQSGLPAHDHDQTKRLVNVDDGTGINLAQTGASYFFQTVSGAKTASAGGTAATTATPVVQPTIVLNAFILY